MNRGHMGARGLAECLRVVPAGMSDRGSDEALYVTGFLRVKRGWKFLAARP